MTATSAEPTGSATATPTEANLLIAFTRIETKVDVALSQHGQELADHELRIREVEQRKTVSPGVLWTSVLGGIGGAAALATIFSHLSS